MTEGKISELKDRKTEVIHSDIQSKKRLWKLRNHPEPVEYQIF